MPSMTGGLHCERGGKSCLLLHLVHEPIALRFKHQTAPELRKKGRHMLNYPTRVS